MNRPRFRALILFWVLFLGFVLVLGRTVQIQLKPHPRLVEIAANKSKWNESRSGKVLLKSRGSILDRNLNEMALSLISKSFFANPKLIDKPSSVAYKLGRILGEPTSKIQKLLSEDRYFVWLKREVDETTARKIENLSIPGIHWNKESRRIYPHGDLAKSVIGVSGRDGSGLEGVEKAYDNWLMVSDEARSLGVRDALGRMLLFRDFDRQWFEGNDVVLTLDVRLQKVMEEELKSVVKEKKALQAIGIMMDPTNGEILAMSSIDGGPNGGEPRSSLRNRAVTDVYEPGSTFKIITAMAALDRLHLSPNSQIYAENGLLTVGPNKIREYNHKKYGWLTLKEMVTFSSNISAAKLALKMGPDNLFKYIENFGFKDRTGIDLPGEARSLVRSPNEWKPIDLANIAFGQGIAVTPLQMTRAVASVANGGYLIEPHIVSYVQSSDEKKERLYQYEAKRIEIWRPEFVRQLRDMMLSVTQEHGTGMAAAISGFEVAGKTGTAQKLKEIELASGRKVKSYSEKAAMASFIGFVPAQEPRFVLYVMVDEAQGVSSGGSVAAPTFRKIAGRALGILGAKPGILKVRKAHSVSRVDDSKFIGKSFQDVLSEIRQWAPEEQKKVELFGYGKAIREEVEGDSVRIYFE
ncbi:MAG: hypothetical protein COV44_06345 [Deltaproteobacteria bacterium CG11_big_fil_rev_8_21_14_0_20_45_16]|nr:MAG: hypothetical protein COV44_06345 [Deltaproteobacteria bacterium CG11_big_fil_rev_8_21_14_0_20_45_16]